MRRGRQAAPRERSDARAASQDAHWNSPPAGQDTVLTADLEVTWGYRPIDRDRGYTGFRAGGQYLKLGRATPVQVPKWSRDEIMYVQVALDALFHAEEKSVRIFY